MEELKKEILTAIKKTLVVPNIQSFDKYTWPDIVKSINKHLQEIIDS